MRENLEWVVRKAGLIITALRSNREGAIDVDEDNVRDNIGEIIILAENHDGGLAGTLAYGHRTNWFSAEFSMFPMLAMVAWSKDYYPFPV
jgi:hypothetical protein